MYEPKTEPFEHQNRALDAAVDRTGFAYLMEMGTGKTKVMIDESGDLFCRNEIDVLMIICPKSVMRTWEREIETHMGVECTVAMWTSSPNKAQKAKMEEVLEKTPGVLRVLIMNVEAFSAGTKAYAYARRVLEHCRTYMGIDESQTIKGPGSKRTKKILELGRMADFRRIASGSPAPNSPMDYYSQLEFIHPGSTRQRSFYGFRARYAVLREKIFGGRRVKVEVGYRNLEELQGIIRQYSFRVRKDECLTLPEKIYTQRSVEFTPEQQRLYREMRTEALAMVGTTFVSSQAAITTLIRLQQITCGFVRDDEGDLHPVNSNRVDAVMEIAESTEEDIIIWTGHRPAVDMLSRALREKYGEEAVAEFHGGNVSTRDDDAARFVSDSSCRFMVATQSAGARGNTWINATQVVYFSNTFNLEERIQSEDRCHRSGQTNHVTYTDLVVEGTVDEKLRESLIRKENISALLVGEDPREWM